MSHTSEQNNSSTIYIDSSVDIVNNNHQNTTSNNAEKNNKHATLIALVDDYMVDTAEISQSNNAKPLGVDLDFNVLRRPTQQQTDDDDDDDDDDLSTAYPPSGTEDELSAPHLMNHPLRRPENSMAAGVLQMSITSNYSRTSHYAGDDERPDDDDDDLSTDLSSVGVMAVHNTTANQPSLLEVSTTTTAKQLLQPCASTDPTMDDSDDASAVANPPLPRDEDTNAAVESPSSRVRDLRRLLERDTTTTPSTAAEMGYNDTPSNTDNADAQASTERRPRPRRRASASMISRISTFENTAASINTSSDTIPTTANSELSSEHPSEVKKEEPGKTSTDPPPRRSLRRSNSFGSLLPSDKTSNAFGQSSGTELGLLEGFYRAQQQQKHQDRQKYKEQWDKYHVDYKEEVLASEIMNDPSAKAKTHANSPGGSQSTSTPTRLDASRSDSFHGSGGTSPPGAGTDESGQKGNESTAAPLVSIPTSLVDYKNKDYKGFVFVVHDTHGLLLLHCTRKKKKPPHYQLPGGHVDEPEFLEAAKEGGDQQTQLLNACKAGAARELYEETGMDIRDSLNRLEPAQLKRTSDDGSTLNEFKGRLFFFLQVSDADFFKEQEQSGLVTAPQSGQPVFLKLSHEHSGFTFEAEPSRAADLLKHHSGGKCSEALLLAMNRGSPPPVEEVIKKPDIRAAQASKGSGIAQTDDVNEVKQVDRQLFSHNIAQMELDIDDPTINVFPDQPKKGTFDFFAECFGGFKDCKF